MLFDFFWESMHLILCVIWIIFITILYKKDSVSVIEIGSENWELYQKTPERIKRIKNRYIINLLLGILLLFFYLTNLFFLKERGFPLIELLICLELSNLHKRIKKIEL